MVENCAVLTPSILRILNNETRSTWYFATKIDISGAHADFIVEIIAAEIVEGGRVVQKRGDAQRLRPFSLRCRINTLKRQQSTRTL